MVWGMNVGEIKISARVCVDASHTFQKAWEGSTQSLPANPLRVGRTCIIAERNLLILWEEIENTWEEFFMK
jgi:hypothetical protein